MLLYFANILEFHRPLALIGYSVLIVFLAAFSIPTILKHAYQGLTKLFSVRFVTVGVLALLAFSFGLYFCMRNIWGYQSFHFGVFDFGIYNQMVSRIAYGLSLDIAYIQQPHFLGDHFQPILYLLAPLAPFFGSSYLLLFIEPLAFISGIIPLYLLGRHFKLPHLFIVIIAFAYFFYADNVIALESVFHPSTFIATFLLWLFYFFCKRKWVGYWAITTLLLMTKENVGIYIAFIGLWQIIFTSDKRLGLATLGYGTLWSLIAIEWLIPYFHHGPYVNAHLDPRLVEDHGALHTVLYHPQRIIEVLFSSLNKRIIVVRSFGFFGFLPLLTPGALMTVPFFAERLLSDNANRAELVFHYGAPVSAILVFSTMMTLHSLLKRYPLKAPVLATALIAGLILSYTFFIPPLSNMVTLKAEAKSQHTKVLTSALKRIPTKSTVIAQDSIAAHLPRQEKIIQLNPAPDDLGKYDYVIVDKDTSNGPIESVEQLKQSYRNIIKSGYYGLIFSQGTTAIWHKGARNETVLSPELEAFIR